MFITEEAVNQVSRFFYEMGLNEEGIYILAEDLGKEEFEFFIEDIIQNSDLTEARKHRDIIRPETKAGKSISSLKGGPRASALKRLKGEGERRRSEEEGARQRAAERSQGFAAFSKSVTPTKPQRPKATRGVGFAVDQPRQSPEFRRSSSKNRRGNRTYEPRPIEDTRTRRRRTKEETPKPNPRLARTETRPSSAALERGKRKTRTTEPDPLNAPYTPKPKRVTVEPRPQQKLLPPARSAAVERAVKNQGPSAEDLKSLSRATFRALADAGKWAWSGHQRAMKEKQAGKTIGQQIGAGLRTMTLKPQYHEDFEFWVNELLNEGYDLSEYTWDDMFDLYEETLTESRRVRSKQSGKKFIKSNYKSMHESADYSKIISHLISEGYVDTIDRAQIMIQHMSDEWMADILN